MHLLIEELLKFMPWIVPISIGIYVITNLITIIYINLMLSSKNEIVNAIYTFIYILIFFFIGYLISYFTGWSIVLCNLGTSIVLLSEVFVISTIVFLN